MYNTRARGKIVLTGSVRSHQGMRVSVLPADLLPSQAMDVLEFEEPIPDTKMSVNQGHVTTSEFSKDDDDDDNAMTKAESKFSSKRESFLHTLPPTTQNKNSHHNRISHTLPPTTLTRNPIQYITNLTKR